MAIVYTKKPCSRCGKPHSNSLAHKRSAYCVPRKESPVATKRKPKPASELKPTPTPYDLAEKLDQILTILRATIPCPVIGKRVDELPPHWTFDDVGKLLWAWDCRADLKAIPLTKKKNKRAKGAKN